jgi:uncharacterized protein YdhG (YjbR/CyaY superfamily)
MKRSTSKAASKKKRPSIKRSKRAERLSHKATIAKSRAKRSSKVTSVDDYLSRLPEPARSTLAKLRKAIAAAAPDAKETISYQVPTFKHHGMLVGFGATARHCALYVMSSTLIDKHKDALSSFEVATGTVKFPHDQPLPSALVKKLVKTRIAENQARSKAKAAAK